MIYRIISRMSILCAKFYTQKKLALVYLFDSYEPTNNNRITPLFDLSFFFRAKVKSLQRGYTSLRLQSDAPRHKTIGFVSRTTQNQDDEVPPYVPLVSGSPFSTSKFDVGQINTLRPATFEVVPVDSGRPVNIGAIVPQRVVGTFWISGAVPLPPRCSFRITAAGITSGRVPFLVKIRIILRAFHEKVHRGISKDAIIAIRSLIHSRSRVYHSHLVIPAGILRKMDECRYNSNVNINNQKLI